MVVYIYSIKAAGKSIILQLCSSCQGNWYSTEKAGGTARPSMPGHSPPASQASRRVGPASSDTVEFEGRQMLIKVLNPPLFHNKQFVPLHRKKKVCEFPVPRRDVTTKLSLGGNNGGITELFLPRGSLVSDIPAGDGKLVNLFLRCSGGNRKEIP
jgi:hypothetical protein